jgi:hypothetical protein
MTACYVRRMPEVEVIGNITVRVMSMIGVSHGCLIAVRESIQCQ